MFHGYSLLLLITHPKGTRRVTRVGRELSIRNKLPQDALNPAHGSLLRVNSPSHGIFSGSGSPLYSFLEETLTPSLLYAFPLHFPFHKEDI